MASNQDFETLATNLRALPAIQDRVHRLLEKVRHELDQAHSNREWDTVQGLSQLLGGNADLLATAIGVDDGKANGQSAVEDSNKPVRRSRTLLPD